eukprot:TRINITY_DN5416_c0_g1_i1.p1 TRINITY_DN5416_c0_g1~~TRINITY_DN5416_c0_g1_i1.p1  ORF type:complete len:291 (+),score=76.98 TRINITY_DN5416_c0_g1_i1:63-935(+)
MSDLPKCDIAIIGGTGVYEFEHLTELKTIEVDTPFGKPSGLTVGKLGDELVLFVARHGANHRMLPTEIPYKANIFACKMMGVKYLFTVSACGSLREDYVPGDLVMIDQFIDRTKNRDATFFGNGVVGHVEFGSPVCDKLHKIAGDAIVESLPNVKVHRTGTYVCMEGPAFSTRAESRMYQKWGGDIIGMTALTEAKLAREAEISYTSVGLVTDFDAWREGEHADVASIMKVVASNSANAQIFNKAVIHTLSKNKFDSPVHTCLDSALMTRGDKFPAELKEPLKVIFGRFY